MISTHVLDTTTGQPAAGVAVTLQVREAGAWQVVGFATTDADGRARDIWHEGRPRAAGHFRLSFATGAWFTARGIQPFHPRVAVEFNVTDPSQHHHVPLLLSPFGYTTYRGS